MSIDVDPTVLPAEDRRQALILLAAIFSVAACALVYELLIATVSSYLLGGTVTQFSLAIGIFIGAMGLGSHLSQRFSTGLLRTFVTIEIALGLLGGSSVLALFWFDRFGGWYWAGLLTWLIVIGGLTGLELPLLARLLKRYGSLRAIIAQALSIDYLGSLAGSLLFPLLLLPTLGLLRTALLIGLLNLGVAAWTIRAFRDELPRWRILLTFCSASALALLGGFIIADRVMTLLESHLYEDQIILTRQTPYQRIVLTRWRNDLRLYLDGNLQFSSVDEYRYHESLVHPAMLAAPRHGSVLVLGGGDGLALRELCKYQDVRQITLVDIDPAMTELCATHRAISALNGGALRDPRVRLVHDDAFSILKRTSTRYDVIIVDLPDPNSEALAKLYTVECYRLLARHLAPGGVCAVQATSPYYSRDAYWCIARTLEAAGLLITPYHTYIPTFGDWGFVLAAARTPAITTRPLPVPTRYLTPGLLESLTSFGQDEDAVHVTVSTLDHPTILNYYQREQRRWE